MVEISDRSPNSAFVTAAGVRQGARALSQVSQAAGREVELTQSNLRTQANNLNTLSSRVGQLALALNGLEEARGIIRTDELSDNLQRATKRSVNRLLQVESLANSRANSAPLGLSGGASIADVIGSLSDNDNSAGRAIIGALGNALRGGSARKPAPVSIFATAATANQKFGDIFGRQLPTNVQAQGRATVDVTRRALEAQIGNVIINPDDPEAVLPTARVVDAGIATRSNEGFVVKAQTGSNGGTVVLDLTDPGGEDGRLSIIDVTGGDGSDVIFLAGANNATVRAGAGNDFVVSDGNAEIYGGAGDDILIGNHVFGEDGDDVLFGNALAIGGTGDDRITMFATGAEDEENPTQGLAFGGDGNDIIIGEAAISADGGDGNDAISLRAGGFANGGAGNDTLTAFNDATLEGGAGDDDIMLLAGGRVDGGDGKDDITATFYSTVSGGKGNDLVRMNTGGVYQFAKGDGVDQVLMGSTLTGQVADWGKTNRIELSGFSRADVDIFVSSNDIQIISRDPAVRDRITLTRSTPGDTVEIVFTKDKKTQTLTVARTGETLGPITPAL
ncbi:MAG: calcium-binding protein [Bosea sp. (in: a-proteobacteria)]